MKKLYVLKLSNKEGKEIFKGKMARRIYVNDKVYNLMGCIDEKDIHEEVIICSALTQKELKYGVISSITEMIDDEIKHGFMVLK